MSIVIVPTYIDDKINAAIDKAFEETPACDVPRDMVYSQCLSHFNDTGQIADVSFQAKS